VRVIGEVNMNIDMHTDSGMNMCKYMNVNIKRILNRREVSVEVLYASAPHTVAWCGA